MEGDPKFVTSLPETYGAAPCTKKRRGSPTNGKGIKRAFSSASSSAGSQTSPPEIAPAGSRSPWNSKTKREMQRGMDPTLSGKNRQKKTSGRHEGQQDSLCGRWGEGGGGAGSISIGRVSSSSDRVDSSGSSSNSSRAFVGEFNKNANPGPSRGSGSNIVSADVGGGKAKSSRWNRFL